MWLTLIEETNQTWYTIELLALSYPYETIQSKIAKTLSSFANVVGHYSEIAERSVQLLTEEYIREHEGLKGKTPAEACGIVIEGKNKWKTLIQNASKCQSV